MKCTGKNGSSVTLDAVYGEGGKVFLQEAAADAFEAGKFYSLDFDAIDVADIPAK